jgi:hypothetical protein
LTCVATAAVIRAALWLRSSIALLLLLLLTLATSLHSEPRSDTLPLGRFSAALVGELEDGAMPAPPSRADEHLDRAGPMPVERRPWYHTGYAWKGSPPAEPDWRGLSRDTGYFLGYQAIIVAVLYLMPSSITK